MLLLQALSATYSGASHGQCALARRRSSSPPGVPPRVCMLDGETPVDSAALSEDSDLWAEFAVAPQDIPTSAVIDDALAADAETGDGTNGDLTNLPMPDGGWDDETDADWDEPSAEEGDMVVDSVAKYLPLLMQKKYGDDWQLLLEDANLDAASLGLDAEAGADAAPSYVDEVAVEEEEDEQLSAGLATEEELQALVAKQKEDDAGDDEYAEYDGSDAPAEVVNDYSHLVGATVEELQTVSPQMADFVASVRDGEIELPEPFPRSEWSHIFLTALGTDARFSELQSTW